MTMAEIVKVASSMKLRLDCIQYKVKAISTSYTIEVTSDISL